MANFSDSLTQGGQTQLHKFHMISQVFGTTLKMSLLLTLVFLIGLVALTHNWESFAFLGVYYKAVLRDQMSFLPNGFFNSSWVCHQGGQWYEVNDHILANHPTYMYAAAVNQALLITKLLQSFIFFLLAFTGVCSFWVWRGKTRMRNEILSGGVEVSKEALIKLINDKKMASDIKLGGLPLLKDSETKHMLLAGTTGAGKTNTINQYLTQIKHLKKKAIIVDATGIFVEKFYNPETDIILNPLDARSQHWDIWKECENDLQADELAASLVPQGLSDPFWADAARSLFVETLKKLKRRSNPSMQVLLDFAVNRPLAKIQKFYAGTPAAALVDIAADKTAASIRVNLATYVRALFLLEDADNSFSIRQWVRDDSKKGWLFLLATPEQRETLRPLLTTWFNTSVNALMSCSPNHQRRVWYVIDELASLNRIDALPKGLAEIRKYGGCLVAGIQNISQIDKIYGHDIRKTMMSLYNTKIFFRSPDAETAQWIAKTVGENEVIENNEGISFGAHQMRDGVSLTEHRKYKPIIPYSEFMTLPDLTAYVKLPEDYPIAKVSFTYQDLPSKNLAFLSKPEKTKEAVLPEEDEDEEIPN